MNSDELQVRNITGKGQGRAGSQLGSKDFQGHHPAGLPGLQVSMCPTRPGHEGCSKSLGQSHRPAVPGPGMRKDLAGFTFHMLPSLIKMLLFWQSVPAPPSPSKDQSLFLVTCSSQPPNVSGAPLPNLFHLIKLCCNEIGPNWTQYSRYGPTSAK